MAKKKESLRIQLTDAQKKQIREATGKEASAIELTLEELEERVSPRTFGIELEERVSPRRRRGATGGGKHKLIV